jgi:hypothetical protein
MAELTRKGILWIENSALRCRDRVLFSYIDARICVIEPFLNMPKIFSCKEDKNIFIRIFLEVRYAFIGSLIIISTLVVVMGFDIGKFLFVSYIVLLAYSLVLHYKYCSVHITEIIHINGKVYISFFQKNTKKRIYIDENEIKIEFHHNWWRLYSLSIYSKQKKLLRQFNYYSLKPEEMKRIYDCFIRIEN